MNNAIEEEKVVMTADEAAFIDRFVAELAVPPGATSDTQLALKVRGKDVAGTFRLSGVALPLLDGAAEIPFGVFLTGIKDTDVSLSRPGVGTVKGRLLFF